MGIMETGEDTTAKFVEILKANEISDEVSEVVVNDAGLQGEGLGSLTKYVTVTFKNPQKPQLNLFMKIHVDNKSHTETLDELKAFEKEARFFLEYVPAVKEYCKEKGHEHLVDIYPKCYYGDNYMTVLENLVLEKGFFMADKELKQDFEYASFSMITLAKHHAMSYAMIQKFGGADKFFEKFPNLDFESFTADCSQKFVGPMLENGLDTNIEILQSHEVEGMCDAISILKSVQGKLFSMIRDIVLEKKWDKLLVLNHGDYWNNNMMYKKDDSGKTIDHKTIDLQVTRYNCPQLDLGTFFFTSVKPEVRQRHLRDLLSLYLSTLKKVGKDLDCDISVTEEELFEGFQNAFKFGFWIGLCIASGPGYAVLKEVDVSKTDINNLGSVLAKAVKEWIRKNPGKGIERAKEIVELLNEYNEILMD